MEFLGKNKAVEATNDLELKLYRALSMGDLPAAWLISKDITEKETPTLTFNCGLCLFMLGETERSLIELKKAEKLLGNPSELDISDKKLFVRSVELSDSGSDPLYLLPLDPEASSSKARYGLIRVRWLTAVCLTKLGRVQEAAPIVRFLSQYGIKIQSD